MLFQLNEKIGLFSLPMEDKQSGLLRVQGFIISGTRAVQHTQTDRIGSAYLGVLI